MCDTCATHVKLSEVSQTDPHTHTNHTLRNTALLLFVLSLTCARTLIPTRLFSHTHTQTRMNLHIASPTHVAQKSH